MCCCLSNVNAKNIQFEFLPAVNLFDAPIADPRWPKFTMGLSHDFKGNLGKRLWNFSFGENIGLAKIKHGDDPYEFGIQAATFGVMDIHSKPTRLINTDYFIGFGLSHSNDNLEQLLQLSHVSSHVGDEFLLSPEGKNFKRINLSYETLKLFLRYKNAEMRPRISPYVSLGYILHVDPGHVKRAVFSAGVDYFSGRFIFSDATRLIAGVNYNSWQENKFRGTATVRAGLQYERTKFCNRYMQLLLQYRQGKSEHGQFYKKNIKSIGILIAYSS
jgi:hypothetical protein